MQKEKRPSGRPLPNPEKGKGRNVTLYLYNDEVEQLKKVGGSAWIRRKLEEAKND